MIFPVPYFKASVSFRYKVNEIIVTDIRPECISGGTVFLSALNELDVVEKKKSLEIRKVFMAASILMLLRIAPYFMLLQS